MHVVKEKMHSYDFVLGNIELSNEKSEYSVERV